MRFRARFVIDTIAYDKKAYRQPLRVIGRRIAKSMRAVIRGGLGGAPKSQSGRLARSVTSKVSKGGMALSVGPRQQGGSSHPRNGFYGRFLQHGTQYIRSMDFIGQTLDGERGYIAVAVTAATRNAFK